MLYFDCVTVDFFTSEIAVNGVQVKALLTRQQTHHFFNVLLQLLNCPGFARIISCSLNPSTAQNCIGCFEPSYVIGLPTVQTYFHFIKFFYSRIGINAKGGILIPCMVVSV